MPQQHKDEHLHIIPSLSQFTGPIRRTQMKQKLTQAGQMHLIEKAAELRFCNERPLNTISQNLSSITAVFVLNDNVKCYLNHKM